MQIAICDDDESELRHLSELIAAYQINRGIRIDYCSFHNGMDFLSHIKGGEYDLILMDILMPGLNGMQIAQELRTLDANVKLIFISASPEFAMESYRVEAYHYLLKPINANDLYPLLDKVHRELCTQEEEKLLLKTRQGIVGISITNLEYVEVINKSVSFHLSDGTTRQVTATLTDFEQTLLHRPEFIKTHRAYLANLSLVQSIELNCLVTKSGCRIPVSRQRRHEVRDAYIHFLQQKKLTLSTLAAQVEAPCKKSGHSDGSWHILLVDDDASDCSFWAGILQSHGCAVQSAKSGQEALTLAQSVPYDCILLDVMIPGENGFSICEKLRKLTHTPIIFLSCLTESDRQLEGFAAGGIDYITKNTPPELFWAKIETRIKLAGSNRTGLCYGPLLLDLAKRRGYINQMELPLTSTEFDILHLLTKHAEHVVTPKEISDIVFYGQPWDGGQTVQIHMSRLRRKLEKAWSEYPLIETVWGQGYRFVLTR